MWTLVINHGDLGLQAITPFDNGDQARDWAIDNLRGYTEGYGSEFHYIVVKTYNPSKKHYPPTCRICGEEGHSWQRCNPD